MALVAVAVVVAAASSDPLLGLLRQSTRPQFLDRKVHNSLTRGNISSGSILATRN